MSPESGVERALLSVVLPRPSVYSYSRRADEEISRSPRSYPTPSSSGSSNRSGMARDVAGPGSIKVLFRGSSVPVPLILSGAPGIEVAEQRPPNWSGGAVRPALTAKLAEVDVSCGSVAATEQKQCFEERGLAAVVSANDQVDRTKPVDLERPIPRKFLIEILEYTAITLLSKSCTKFVGRDTPTSKS